MKKLILFLLLCGAAFAQSGKFDLYTGAAFQHADGGPNYYGWEASGTYNLNNNLGIFVDGAGTYNHGAGHYLNIGPSWTFNTTDSCVLKPWVSVSTGIDFAGTHPGPNFMLGAGVDVPLSKRVSLRPVDLNYYLYHHDQTYHSLWYSGGLVFHF